MVRGALLASAVLLAIVPACALRKDEVQLGRDALARGARAQNAGDPAAATVHYFRALSHDPRNRFAYYNLGVIARVANKPGIAESYYRQALEIDPGFGPALFDLAVVRTGRGSPEEAIALYRRMLVFDPNHAAAHYNLGLLLRAIGQVAEGDNEIAVAIALASRLLGPTPIPPTARPSPTAAP